MKKIIAFLITVCTTPFTLNGMGIKRKECLRKKIKTTNLYEWCMLPKDILRHLDCIANKYDAIKIVSRLGTTCRGLKKKCDEITKEMVNKVISSSNTREKNYFFYWACKDGYVPVIEQLLNSASFNDIIARTGGRVFLNSVENGCIQTVKTLLASEKITSTMVSGKDFCSQNALMLASKNGYIKIVQTLLKSKKFSTITTINEKDNQGKTVLMHARYHSNIFKILLASEQISSKTLNATNKDDWTTLMFAIGKDPELINLLLASKKVSKSTINKTNNCNRTAIDMAAELGYTECVKSLIESNKVFKVEGALYSATLYGNTETVKTLLASNKIIESIKNPEHWKNGSAFRHVATSGYTEIIRAFLKSPEVIQYLLNQTSEYDGNTALICATKEGHYEVVKALVQTQKVNVNIRNKNGKTALEIAQEKGFTNIVNLLKNYITKDRT